MQIRILHDELTKRPGESRIDAAVRAKVDSIALRVKLADNADNQDMTRMLGVNYPERRSG